MSSDLTIYGHWVSQPSRAIMWILNMKNIPFKFVETSPQTGDTRKPEYLAKFPTHTIPAMECDGIKIAESNAILLFLAEKFGWDDLYPKDVKTRAEIHQYLFWHPSNTRLCSGAIFRPKLILALTGKSIEAPKESLATLKEGLLMIDKWLSKGGYIVGNSLTIADFACYCEIDQLILGEFYDLSPYPSIMKWIETMKKLPYHEEAHVGRNNEETSLS